MVEPKAFLEAYFLPEKCLINLGKRKRVKGRQVGWVGRMGQNMNLFFSQIWSHNLGFMCLGIVGCKAHLQCILFIKISCIFSSPVSTHPISFGYLLFMLKDLPVSWPHHAPTQLNIHFPQVFVLRLLSTASGYFHH